MTFISYAQNGEDVILWRAVGHVREGFYIDVGACNPEDLSVTRAFYERGWRGINVEPERRYFDLCAAKRSCDINLNVAVTAKCGIARFMVVDRMGLSTTVEAVAAQAADQGWSVETQYVPALSLADICDSLSLQHVHFLKIDVEGGERGVLEGADFDRFRPWVIVIEATAPNSTERNEHLWEGLLAQARYQRAFFDGINLYYTAEEHRDLIEKLAAPPNVLDDFKPIRLVEAEERIGSLTAELEARQREWDDARAALDALREQHETLARESARKNEAIQQEVSALQEHIAQLTRAAQEAAVYAAQSGRRIFEMEDQADVVQRALASIAGSLGLRSATNQQLETIVSIKDVLEQQATTIAALQSQYTALQEHRDKLLSSTSWRLTAPLRKIRTALRVALQEPHHFVALARRNLGLGQPSAEGGRSDLAKDTQPAVAGIVDSSVALSEPIAVPGSSAFESLDRRGQLTALICHDTAQRRFDGV
jgi:FkbM family methyltransferase